MELTIWASARALVLMDINWMINFYGGYGTYGGTF